MSRTDKSKPLWVRQREHGAVPVHDHRFGTCDLPPQPLREDASTRCRWESPEALLMGHECCSGCHKRGCTAEWQAYNRTANRRRRHADRLRTHQWVRKANTR
ncbi:hypothetical protein [Nocardiopsis ansamitocini]|uniref:Uncharacterized protein n=1 Tax=Nocardiopsis ansamitocini TaxID=1670832 RepID=A0A9W6P2X3_9ACTN|nr:hypothetical protein [Nocardiopsis ansamitocini]GLU46285.1 hypothetical protein Nans01_06360 [Nocardiopsis ansamitocini]